MDGTGGDRFDIREGIRRGGDARSIVVPSPSWPPNAFHPQHLTPPPSVSAHVCAPPAATARAPANTSVVVGVLRLVLEPSPISPYSCPSAYAAFGERTCRAGGPARSSRAYRRTACSGSGGPCPLPSTNAAILARPATRVPIG
jgi:hypothetical protein